MFEREITHIPKGYTKDRKPREGDWISKYYWNPNQKPIQRKKVPHYDKWKWYNTHDNGGTPYVVYVNDNKNRAVVYQIPKKDYYVPDSMYLGWRRNFPAKNRQLFHEKFGTFVGKVFIGEDPCKKSRNGNSILVKTGKNEYTYIGTNIFSFQTPNGDKIIRYFSLIGNNDVPYSVALGEKYVYIIDNGTYIPRENFKFNENFFPCGCCTEGRKGKVYGNKDKDVLFADAYYTIHHGENKDIKGEKKLKGVKYLSSREIDR